MTHLRAIADSALGVLVFGAVIATIAVVVDALWDYLLRRLGAPPAPFSWTWVAVVVVASVGLWELQKNG